MTSEKRRERGIKEIKTPQTTKHIDATGLSYKNLFGAGCDVDPYMNTIVELVWGCRKIKQRLLIYLVLAFIFHSCFIYKNGIQMTLIIKMCKLPCNLTMLFSVSDVNAKYISKVQWLVVFLL